MFTQFEKAFFVEKSISPFLLKEWEIKNRSDFSVSQWAGIRRRLWFIGLTWVGLFSWILAIMVFSDSQTIRYWFGSLTAVVSVAWVWLIPTLCLLVKEIRRYQWSFPKGDRSLPDKKFLSDCRQLKESLGWIQDFNEAELRELARQRMEIRAGEIIKGEIKFGVLSAYSKKQRVWFEEEFEVFRKFNLVGTQYDPYFDQARKKLENLA